MTRESAVAAQVGNISLEEKKNILTELLSDISAQNELLLIDDWRSIVRFGGEMAEWLLDVAKMLPENRVVMAMASAYPPEAKVLRGRHDIYHVRLRELDKEERIGLLKRYLRDVANKPDVLNKDLGDFRYILNGYPEQAIFAGELIATQGLPGAIARSSEIVDFSRDKASLYVERYADDPEKLEFLTKLEIAVDIKSLKDIRAAISQIREGENGDQQARVMITRAEIIAMALSGMKGKALARVETDLPFLFPAAKDKLRAKINAL